MGKIHFKAQVKLGFRSFFRDHDLNETGTLLENDVCKGLIFSVWLRVRKLIIGGFGRG